MMQKWTFITDNLHVEWHGDKGSPVQKLHKVTFSRVQQGGKSLRVMIDKERRPS